MQAADDVAKRVKVLAAEEWLGTGRQYERGHGLDLAFRFDPSLSDVPEVKVGLGVEVEIEQTRLERVLEGEVHRRQGRIGRGRRTDAHGVEHRRERVDRHATERVEEVTHGRHHSAQGEELVGGRIGTDVDDDGDLGL